MTTGAATLQRDDTVRKALQILLQQRVLGVPVVDKDGRYIGMFARSAVIGIMLPRVLSLEDRLPDIARLIDAGYVSDTIEDVRARFESVAGDPVERHMQTDVPVLRPDSPIVNALLFLHRYRNFLPVVEDGSGHLVGIISTWDVLGRITG